MQRLFASDARRLHEVNFSFDRSKLTMKMKNTTLFHSSVYRNIFDEMRVLNDENQKDVRTISSADSETPDGNTATDLHVVLYVRHQLLLRLRR